MEYLGFCLILVVSLLSLTAANYPLNPRVENSDYRSITVRWDNITNFNASGMVKEYIYQIDAQLVSYNATKYLLSSTYVLFSKEPVITVSDLFVNSYVEFRIDIESDPSPNVTFGTKSIKDLGEVVVPGKVRNINVKDYAKQSGAHEITWDRPTNIASATGNDSSVSYRIRQCHYNPLLTKTSKCEVVGVVVGNPDQDEQNSYQKGLPYHHQFIVIPENRDMLIEVIAIALNLTEGLAETKTMRLDPASVPKTPSNLRNTTIYRDSITIAWDYDDSWPTFEKIIYLIAYKKKGDADENTKETSMKVITLGNLKNSTLYEIRVAVSESINGTSLYSSVYTLQTNEEPSPTIAPPSNASGVVLSTVSLIAFAMLSISVIGY